MDEFEKIVSSIMTLRGVIECCAVTAVRRLNEYKETKDIEKLYSAIEHVGRAAAHDQKLLGELIALRQNYLNGTWVDGLIMDLILKRKSFKDIANEMVGIVGKEIDKDWSKRIKEMEKEIDGNV